MCEHCIVSSCSVFFFLQISVFLKIISVLKVITFFEKPLVCRDIIFIDCFSMVFPVCKQHTQLWAFLFVRTLLRGEELYTQMGFFFVPWIFAARYIHRRELRLVSLESSSSVEYGIKKIFLIFDFYRELSRFKVLRKEEWIHVVFIHIFRNFLPKFSSILLKFVIIFKNSVVDFIFEDEQALLIVLI